MDDNIRHYADSPKELASELEQITIANRKYKGQHPNASNGLRRPKEELWKEYKYGHQHADRIAQGQVHGPPIVISKAYPPSIQPLHTLEPIASKQLLAETHHRGKVIFVRTIDDPCRISSVQNLVEDIDGTLEWVSVYNTDPVLAPNEILPKNKYFAIKEPYCKVSWGANGGVLLRLDHPSDLVLLPSNASFIAQAHVVEPADCRTPAQCKMDGNTAFAKRRFEEARKLYSAGIVLCGTPDVLVKKDLYRNRAQALLNLGRYEDALVDAKEAVVETSSTSDAAETTIMNGKAFYRAGVAAYHLRQFHEGSQHFTNALKLQSKDKNTNRVFQQTIQRLKEATHGKYDIAAMYESRQEALPSRMDCADYVKLVEVRPSPGRGRGLFSRVPIKAGQLVLCEKAFSICFAHELKPRRYEYLNLNTREDSNCSQVGLHDNLRRELNQNPKQGSRLLHLYDNNSGRPAEIPIVDGRPAVDSLQVSDISEYNRFYITTVQEEIHMIKHAIPLAKNDITQGGAGIWIMASYINHDCNGNVGKAILGDAMLMHATKDIAAGEEIFVPYHYPDVDHRDTRKQVHGRLRIDCKCRICVVEGQCSTQDYDARKAVNDKIVRFLQTYNIMDMEAASGEHVVQAMALFSDMTKTYDAQRFANTPLLGVLSITEWICFKCWITGHYQECARIGMLALRLLGFDLQETVTPRGFSLIIDRENGFRSSIAGSIAFAVGYSYQKMGAVEYGRVLREFADSLGRAFMGVNIMEA